MATTRYTVSATKRYAEKTMSNLRSARTEADLRAKQDKMDVTVTTVATGRLAYTAHGAPLHTPAEQAPSAPATEDAAPATEDALSAEFAQMVREVQQEQADEKPEAADEEGQPQEAPAKTAPCGCPVKDIVESGTHTPQCADAPAPPAPKAAPRTAKKTTPRTAAPRTATGKRATQGECAVPGWGLLYNKPQRNAQVGRDDQGRYALICVTHKTARIMDRLVQDRELLRQGGWCKDCGQ